MALNNHNDVLLLRDKSSSELLSGDFNITLKSTSVIDGDYDKALDKLDWEKLVELIEEGADYLRCKVEGENNTCILGKCVYFHKNHIVTLVIKKQKEKTEYSMKFQSQCTYALWVICNNNNCELVEILLGAGAEIIENFHPHTAAESGAWRVLEELKKNTPNLNLNRFDAENNTPLYYASKNGYVHTINWLLSNGADVNLANSKGDTALHVACQDADEDSVHLLIKRGADINTTNEQGETPVLIAARIGKEGHIIILSGEKANLDKRDKDGNFPLQLACENGHTSVIKELITNGASFRITNDDWHSCMLRAIQCRRDASAAMCIRLYPSENFLEECRKSFDIPFVDLVKFEMTETVNALLDRMVVVGSDMQKGKWGNNLKGKVLTKYLDMDGRNRMPSEEDYEKNETYLLQQISRHCSEEITHHGTIRLLVDRKMKKFGYQILAIKLFFYVIFLSALAYSLIEASYDTSPLEVFNNNGEVGFLDLLRLVAEVFTIFYFITNLITEGVEFFRVALLTYHHINRKKMNNSIGEEDDESNAMEIGTPWMKFMDFIKRMNRKIVFRVFTDYFGDRSNYWDVTGLLSLLILFILRASRLPLQWIFACLTFFINSMRLFKLILLIPVLGPYSTIIYKVLRNDVPKFATLFLITLFIFTGTFFISLRVPYSLSGLINATKMENTARVPGIDNQVWWVFLSGLKILVQGNVYEDMYSNYTLEYLNCLSAAIYIAFLFLTVIVFSNVFIAQLSDTYAKFERRADYSFAWYRLNFIVQIERTSFLSIFMDIRKKYYTESIKIGKSALNEYYKVNDLKFLNVKSFNENVDEKRMLNTIQTQQKISEKLKNVTQSESETICLGERFDFIDNRMDRFEQRFDLIDARMERIFEMLTKLSPPVESLDTVEI